MAEQGPAQSDCPLPKGHPDYAEMPRDRRAEGEFVARVARAIYPQYREPIARHLEHAREVIAVVRRG